MAEPATATVPVTAVILTLNEAANIAPCLRALARLNEVYIVDSGSTDGTRELARQVRRDAKILTHDFKDFGDQRNWAIDNIETANEWFLFVDADEYCTRTLIDEIESFIASAGEHAGAFIAGRNYFLGRWLKRVTLYPSYQLRLVRKGRVRFVKEGHGQRELVSGPVAYLKEGWRHEAFSKGVHQWIERHNQYSTDEVELIVRLGNEPLKPTELASHDPIIRRRALKRLAARLPFRGVIRFLYVYFLKLGFLDGYPGLLYCRLRLAHNIHISAKIAERKWRAKSETEAARDRSGGSVIRRR